MRVDIFRVNVLYHNEDMFLRISVIYKFRANNLRYFYPFESLSSCLLVLPVYIEKRLGFPFETMAKPGCIVPFGDLPSTFVNWTNRLYCFRVFRIFGN